MGWGPTHSRAHPVTTAWEAIDVERGASATVPVLLCLAAAMAALTACSSDEQLFVEPHGVLIWSVDDQPAVLPPDSPARSDPTMFVDELRNAAVLVDDGEQLVVVGDAHYYVGPDETFDAGAGPNDGDAQRFAYLLDAEARVVQLLGVFDGDSSMYNHVPGRSVGAALAPAATTAYASTSAEIREVPVHTDPGTGQRLSFYVAPEGETLLRLDAYDDEGRLTNSVGPLGDG